LNRFKVIATESWRSLGANLSTTLAATLTIVIAMFLLGLSIALGTLLLSYGDSVKKQLGVNVFFCTSDDTPSARKDIGLKPLASCTQPATKAQENAVAAQLQADPRVKKLEFTSKEQALKIMQKRDPSAVAALAANPFPDKIRVIPKHGEDTVAIANSLKPLPTGVASADPAQKQTHVILGFAHALEIGFIIAVTLLVVAATLLVGNTIRLSIFSRRREIEVMKLVGATNWFVRGPFMLEGVICGVVGAIGAILLLILGKALILGQLPHGLRSGGDVQAIPFAVNAVVLVGAGLLLGSLGSGLTIRRFLRV
jgi:cell division transport system permease protein